MFRMVLWLSTLSVMLVSLLGMAFTQPSITVSSSSSMPQYATWQGSGPDKWASIWLIERFIAPNTAVTIVPENTYLNDAVMFDVPNSDYLRDGQQTTFAKLLSSLLTAWQTDAHSELQSTPASFQQALATFNTILHDVEVNTWQPNTLAVSSFVEQAFRDLQNEFQREAIPRACYQQLFDQLFERLLAGGEGAITDAEVIKPARDCALVANNAIDTPRGQSSEVKQPLVEEVTPDVIASYLRRGQQVVFIDVREPAEFEEIRIPGARNVQIRHFNQAIADELQSADLIISYCVKDFRGYEMAAKIARAGLPNSTIMKPYGIKGWIDAGLPVYREENREEKHEASHSEGSEGDAIKAMHQCLLHPSQCASSVQAQGMATL